jgi:hypothetical protein
MQFVQIFITSFSQLPIFTLTLYFQTCPPPFMFPPHNKESTKSYFRLAGKQHLISCYSAAVPDILSDILGLSLVHFIRK